MTTRDEMFDAINQHLCSLDDEINCQGDELMDLNAERAALRAENARLREALEQYADAENWYREPYLDASGQMTDMWCGGGLRGRDRAEAALKGGTR